MAGTVPPGVQSVIAVTLAVLRKSYPDGPVETNFSIRKNHPIVRLTSAVDVLFPKPKVGGSTPLGTAIRSTTYKAHRFCRVHRCNNFATEQEAKTPLPT